MHHHTADGPAGHLLDAAGRAPVRVIIPPAHRRRHAPGTRGIGWALVLLLSIVAIATGLPGAAWNIADDACSDHGARSCAVWIWETGYAP